jgi:hypothetical protein
MKIKFNKYMIRNNLFTIPIWFMLFSILLGVSVVHLFFIANTWSIEFLLGTLIINFGLYINGFVSFK